MKYGLQQFGIAKEIAADPKGTFERLAAMGYGFLEPCIDMDGDMDIGVPIWTIDEFRVQKPVLEACGLDVISCHVMTKDMIGAIPKMQMLAKDYGVKQFGFNTPGSTKEQLQEKSFAFIQVAEALEKVGGKVMLHNGSGDVAAQIEGKSSYEWFLDICLGHVYAQIDTGWAMVGGADAEAMLWRNKDRIISVHYKDFKDASKRESETCIGNGAMDLKACFQFARAWGFPQLLDQDLPDPEIGDVMANVEASIQNMWRVGAIRDNSVSYLNTMNVETGEVKVLRKFDKVIEAPNWLKKENALLFNSEGLIYHYDLDTDTIKQVDTGECQMCNNDHVVSADEKYLAVSHETRGENPTCKVYALPLEGGEARMITPNSPSYLHGWSPDGKELAYCAFRMVDGKREVDVYTIPFEGGEEKRITNGGFNDGPEYSPDGKHIWVNSTRSGLMQIWRMNCDGTDPVQMTTDESNNWFAHISPDGKKVVYLSYQKGHCSPGEHLPNMQVELWIMDYDGTNKRKLLSFFGGQGTINVNSWAKDSKHIAFVSYELKHK